MYVLQTVSLFLFLLFSCANSQADKSAPAMGDAETVVQAPAYTMDELMGKIDPAKHPDFVLIEAPYASRSGMYMRRAAYEAFKKMHAAAARDGIQLVIISAARNFEAQKGIWEAKWNGSRTIENGKNAATAYPDPATRALKILEYSSMPGSSRHHWGTDIDLNDLNPAWFQSGTGKKIHDWLTANGPEFGFCQPYSPKSPERPNGYNEEQWHWSYMPISRELTALAEKDLKNEMITGFAGANTAAQIDVVKNYVLGINPACR